jgi:outer membrane protein TolC
MQLARIILVLPLMLSELWAQSQPSVNSGAVPVPDALTLTSALQLAKANSVQFQAARADAALAKEDRVQARSSLLPAITYNNQFLYTEGNGTPTGRFLANNGVHEYVSQANAHEVFSAQQFAGYRKTGAVAAFARARAEVASRGLTVTVVQDYYAVLASQRKYANARSAAEEAARFLQLSEKLENGGEVAHSDVLKAHLQFNDRKRDLGDSEAELLRSRMDMSVLVMPNVSSDFKVVDDLDEPPLLPDLANVRKAAAEKSPELKAALAALQASAEEVSTARAGHLPSLALDYFYGIDATHFAVRTDGSRDLGYAAVATLNIPIFTWGATQSKVRQSLLRKDQASLELTTAQKQLLANIENLYNEAQTAATQIPTLQQSVEFATESLRLIVLRYQAGESTVLEVVDAQNTLNAARNAYVDGSRRSKIALANLQTLTGTL